MTDQAEPDTEQRRAVSVLRRERVEADHFRTLEVLPVLGIASCLLLLWQLEAGPWLRAGILLAVGVLLHVGTQSARRRRGPDRESVAPAPDGVR